MGCISTKFDRVKPMTPSFRPSSYHGGGLQNFYDSSKKWVSRKSSSSKSEAAYAVPSRNMSLKSDCRDEMCKLLQDLLTSYYRTIKISPSTKAQCEIVDKLLEHLQNNDLTEEQYLIFLHYIKEEFVRLLAIADPIELPSPSADNEDDLTNYAAVFPEFIVAEQKIQSAEAVETAPATVESAETNPIIISSKIQCDRSANPESPRRLNRHSFSIVQELLSILPQ